MPYPYALYLKKKLIKTSSEELKKKLADLKLPFPDENELKLIAKLELPDFDYNDDTELLFLLPSFYRPLSAMILADMPYEEIANKMAEFKFPFKFLELLMPFETYFSNFKLLGPFELEKYLNFLKLHNPKLFRAYKAALHNNIEELFWHAGLKPKSLPTESLLELLFDIHFMLKYSLKSKKFNLEKKARVIDRLGTFYIQLIDRIRTGATPSELEKEFKFLLEQQTDQFESLEDLDKLK